MTKLEMKSAEEWAESSLLGLMTFDTKRGRPVVKRLADVIEAVQYEAFLAGAVAMREAAAKVVRFGPDAYAIRAIDPKNLKGGK